MRKIIPVIAAGATGLLIAAGSFAYASVDKAVTLSVDGRQTSEQTYAATVGDFLAAEGISVGAQDVVAPAADSKLSDGSRVTVLYGREVTVKVDGKARTFWTTATDVGGALAGLNLKLDGADMSTSRSTSIGREGIAVDIATVKAINLTNAGTQQTVKITGRTVAEVLKAAKITVDANDKVSPAVKTVVVNGTKVSYVRVDVKIKTKITSIAHDSRDAYTSRLDKGATQVDTEGVDGSLSTSYTETYENGKLVTSVKGKASTTKQPVTEVVLIGTKEKPTPPPPPPPPPTPDNSDSSDTSGGSDNSGSADSGSSSSDNSDSADSGSSSSDNSDTNSSDNSDSSDSSDADSSDSSDSSNDDSSPSVASGSVWDRLAQCESGGNWSINTGNGFYGGLQFTLSTWRGFGGTGMPHEASRETQIAVATKVQASQGWGAWPACTQKLGIR